MATIRVREAATEVDVQVAADIHFAAFRQDAMNILMHPPNGVPSAEGKTAFAAMLRPTPAAATAVAVAEKDGDAPATVSAAALPDSTKQKTILVLAESSVTGATVGYAKWTLREEPLVLDADDGSGNPPPSQPAPPGDDGGVREYFFGALKRKRRECTKDDPALALSQPLKGTYTSILVLEIIAANPQYQRSGAASAILSWGTKLADGLGLPTFLEATAAGYPLYLRYGYEPVDVLDFNVTERWGLQKGEGHDWGTNSAVGIAGPLPEGVYRIAIMRRLPRPLA
ncbi:hypothetical protein HK405_004774 [Cladochytrium tenue]|nr:hypothetical protein HK405_004774 [Cladochytrium tenue]